MTGVLQSLTRFLGFGGRVNATGTELEMDAPRKRRSYCLWQEGDQWFAVRGDWTRLRRVMGIGDTPTEAVENLTEELAREEGGGN